METINKNKDLVHNFDQTILRAYDIRGIVGKTLTKKDAFFIGKAFATFVIINSKKDANNVKISVGLDGRISSPTLESELVKGMLTTGAEVVRIGIGPTPMLYHSVKLLQADAGIMITGSHNPPQYNGFKMMMHDRPIHGEDILNIGKICQENNFIENKGGSVYFERIEDDYIEYLSQFIDEKNEHLKIAWDAGNGATGNIMQKLSKKIHGNHLLLNEKIDGTFPSHHPDPSLKENMQELINNVIRYRCDLGIAFDGDGDRVGIIDNEGRMVYGDQILNLLARKLLEEKPGAKIIADVKTSQNVFNDIENLDGKAIMWKTGHSLIKTKMAQEEAELAGEMSGHIFYKENYYFDDALFATIKLINLCAKADIKIADLLAKLPKSFSTAEVKIEVNEDIKFALIDKLKTCLKNAKLDFIDIDGVRVKLENGWWLLRASNTQNCLVTRCEADDKDNLVKVKDHLSGFLQKIGI